MTIRTNGQIAWETFYAGLCSPKNWALLSTDEQARWEAAAHAVRSTSAQPELAHKVADVESEHYLIVQPTELGTVADTLGRGIKLRLEAFLPDFEELHTAPGSNKTRLRMLMEMIKAGNASMKLVPTTRAVLVAEAARRQPDGSIRPLLPDEASW